MRLLERGRARLYLATMERLTTSAIVLHTFPYSETSKIVRLATRELGVQSAMAKGARRPKSRFGARLELFSTGTAHLYVREHRDLHTLGAYDLERQRLALALDFGRYAAAGVMAELMIRCAPPAELVPAFDVIEEGLDVLVGADRTVVDTVALRQVWRLVETLGYGPSLRSCARDGKEVDPAHVSFSAADGGVLCPACASTRGERRLSTSDYDALLMLTEEESGLPSLDERHAAAHRRLVADFIRFHLAEGRNMEALTMWEKRAWTVTSS